MDINKKACCARAAGWALVGIVIAVAWGIGNLGNGMSPLSAFAIPGAVILALLGVVTLASLNVPWFNRLCACPPADSADKKRKPRAPAGMGGHSTA
jgi:hypothetical protein